MTINGSMPPASPSGDGLVRLAANDPIGEAPVALDAGDDAVLVEVVAIRNPGLQGVHVDVTMASDVEGERVVESIGTVSPFPADQASAYVLPLSDRALALVANSDGGAWVELRLRPADSARPLAADIELLVEVELIAAASIGGSP